ncbi:hypothetical protein ACFPT7_14845 [Acidicapsa dinghuensis]|uniref:Uncharacterized protein n=1 Tax=Acidicapsa dinghuensis TaxID=2218256 RepID=A0ABW1EID5_9BACT|nr:hypothetical protein [Acidicapsa dinghuensis]
MVPPELMSFRAGAGGELAESLDTSVIGKCGANLTAPGVSTQC